MTHPTANTVEWYTDQLNKFVGWTVAGTLIADPMSDGGFYALILQNPEKTGNVAVWFQSDDEGNWPGSFEIQRL